MTDTALVIDHSCETSVSESAQQSGIFAQYACTATPSGTDKHQDYMEKLKQGDIHVLEQHQVKHR